MFNGALIDTAEGLAIDAIRVVCRDVEDGKYKRADN